MSFRFNGIKNGGLNCVGLPRAFQSRSQLECWQDMYSVLMCFGSWSRLALIWRCFVLQQGLVEYQCG